MVDPFEPRLEPAKSIYLAFLSEAKQRNEGDLEESFARERKAVLAEAQRQATALGLRMPCMEDVENADNYAMGSSDYGAKLAYRLTEIMRRGE